MAGLAEYFDGHFVTIEPGFATKVPFDKLTVDDDVAAGREEVGNAALVDDRHRPARGILDVAEPEAKPSGVRVAVRLADDAADERDRARSARSWLGLHRRRSPPAIEV